MATKEVIKIRTDIYDEIRHYKNRNSPWIKLHASLYKVYGFNMLPDASKAHFIGLLMIANETLNCTENDPSWLRKRLHASRRFDLKPLIDSGLITIHASKTLESCYQDDSRLQKEIEKENKKERENVGDSETEPVDNSKKGERKKGEPPRGILVGKEKIVDLCRRYPSVRIFEEVRKWENNLEKRGITPASRDASFDSWMDKGFNMVKTNGKSCLDTEIVQDIFGECSKCGRPESERLFMPRKTCQKCWFESLEEIIDEVIELKNKET